MRAPYEKITADFHFRSDNKGSIPLTCAAHLHYHVEIAYIEDGEIEAVVDSESCRVSAGDLLVVFPNRIHRFEHSGSVKYKLFIISPDLVPDLAYKINHEAATNPVIKDAKQNKRLMSLMKILSETEKISSHKDNDVSRDVVMKGYLLAFFGELLSMMPLSKNRSDDSQAIRTILDYCSQNFRQDISLSSLEEEIHLSKYYISHLFGDKLGVSFNEYINSLRVSEACRYLRLGKKSITEISELSGFGTLRTFNRAFQKQMGMSPSEYRKSKKYDNYSASVPS